MEKQKAGKAASHKLVLRFSGFIFIPLPGFYRRFFLPLFFNRSAKVPMLAPDGFST